MANTRQSTTEGRGWHGDPEGHAEAGRKGGEAVSQDRGHMAEIGRKGGEVVSQDREHMAEIGRKGGLAHHEAASHHEAAAHHHRQAAHYHEENDQEQARRHASRAHEHATRAHESSTRAHQASHGSDWQPHTKHGDLTSRSDLPDSVFAFPKQRKEPLTDASHVKNALARFDQVEGVSDQERDEAFRRIKKAAEQYGVDIRETHWRELGKQPHTANTKR